jgi:hypothetical protein
MATEKNADVEPVLKEWHRPMLRKLPIAATAGTNKAVVKGNDGQGQGKGDVSVLNS